MENIPEDNSSSPGDGYTIMINCHPDGMHDVVRLPMQPATEEQYPDGAFGLETIDDTLRAVLVLKEHVTTDDEEDHAMMDVYKKSSVMPGGDRQDHARRQTEF